jgi:hypothetical protein
MRAGARTCRISGLSPIAFPVAPPMTPVMARLESLAFYQKP